MEHWGVSCVEHIKLLPREDFTDIFKDDKVGTIGLTLTLRSRRLIINVYSLALNTNKVHRERDRQDGL